MSHLLVPNVSNGGALSSCSRPPEISEERADLGTIMKKVFAPPPALTVTFLRPPSHANRLVLPAAQNQAHSTQRSPGRTRTPSSPPSPPGAALPPHCRLETRMPGSLACTPVPAADPNASSWPESNGTALQELVIMGCSACCTSPSSCRSTWPPWRGTF
ncbi:PREDICTED: uncharacterized protein LOC105598347 isoform X2 [Cercocebus atys]|uniref:uncharacterized protein LOC105598347 isoform X2 n=1 Tax=Cercocebus atys TaxID=9531 RepID=UPI0005F580B6|nr:PREDICTED: uncharacterized protein LOC105598347 isoform X2 [Cercocebus atys]